MAGVRFVGADIEVRRMDSCGSSILRARNMAANSL